jgi:penicillin G amidase
VVNPRQGWLVNWNNVPSEGWTAGDSEASEREAGRFHRATWLSWLVRDLARDPTWERAQGVIVREGTIAQQRPLAARRLGLARRGATGRAAQALDVLLRWDGSYHATDANGTVDPGVALWETFKDEAEQIALDRLAGPVTGARHLAGETGSSHAFDITNGEAFALRALSRRGYRAAAAAAFAQLARRFGTEDAARWREPRRMYDVEVQGAAAKPDLPFFDRGTWEQLVELSP